MIGRQTRRVFLADSISSSVLKKAAENVLAHKGESLFDNGALPPFKKMNRIYPPCVWRSDAVKDEPTSPASRTSEESGMFREKSITFSQASWILFGFPDYVPAARGSPLGDGVCYKTYVNFH